MNYSYNCIITRVVDGDTVDVDIDLGFGVTLRQQRIRLYGIDAPESRTSDPEEKIYGIYSKKYVERLLPVGSKQTLISMEYKGKYGRILGDFIIESGGTIATLCNQMVADNVAVAYNGQSKLEIEDEHLKNRQLLIDEGKIIYE